MWRRQVLRERFPGVDLHSDVRFVERPWTELANIDVMAGGFPCQDVSQAGAKAGINGSKSGLWTHFSRLIGECSPQYVIIENVNGLRFRGMETVLRDLSSRGYDAEWETIPARAFGAPHRRDRVFIVAYKAGTRVPSYRLRALAHSRSIVATGQRTGAPLDRSSSRSAYTPGLFDPPIDCGPHLSDKLLQCCPDRVFCGHSLKAFAAACQQCYWKTDGGVRRVADGLPEGLDRNRRLGALGDALIPALAEYIGWRVLAHATH
jgi:C-5 cytosine-specific DNA methylase